MYVHTLPKHPHLFPVTRQVSYLSVILTKFWLLYLLIWIWEAQKVCSVSFTLYTFSQLVYPITLIMTSVGHSGPLRYLGCLGFGQKGFCLAPFTLKQILACATGMNIQYDVFKTIFRRVHKLELFSSFLIGGLFWGYKNHLYKNWHTRVYRENTVLFLE